MKFPQKCKKKSAYGTNNSCMVTIEKARQIQTRPNAQQRGAMPGSFPSTSNNSSGIMSKNASYNAAAMQNAPNLPNFSVPPPAQPPSRPPHMPRPHMEIKKDEYSFDRLMPGGPLGSLIGSQQQHQHHYTVRRI